MKPARNHIGFVATRLAGTDGVSLETIKIANTLHKLNFECFFFAGESDWPEDRSYVVSEANFRHPEVLTINAALFDSLARSSETSSRVQKLKEHLKKHLYEFIDQYQLRLLVIENALAIPMNVPLGMAITEVIAETDMPVIAHHHDFSWERSRFSVNAAGDYLRAAFPPTLPSIRHVVINSFAARQLALRTGASSITLIPNVMDFEQPPPEPDDYADDLRAALGLEDQCFVLQPTRIVPRKRIEHAIDLVRLLDMKATLVISHSAGDEGLDYLTHLQDYAQATGVNVLFAANHFAVNRQMKDGRKIYSLEDAYQQADLVTYPSIVEGFGNAFLETIYYKKPIVMNTYEIFKTDIEPKGFRIIGFENFITHDTVQKAQRILEKPDAIREMVEHNYQLGRRYYSYRVLEERLTALLTDCLGTE